MRKKFTKFLAAFALLVFMTPTMVGWGQTRTDTETSYVFNSKSWGTTTTNWTSIQDGNQLTSGQGIQVTTGTSGACGNSPIEFSSISKVEVQYCTNASKGEGTITVYAVESEDTQYSSDNTKIGSTFTVTKPSSGGTTLKTATFTPTEPINGYVQIYVTCSTNSVYVHSVTITTTSGGGGSDTYTVTYNANDATSGDVPEDTNEYGSGDEVTVLGNTGNLAKTHYSFGGWCMNTQGTGTVYGPAPLETSFVISGSTTLYAKWNPNTNTVTLPTTDEYGEYTMDATNPVAYGTTVNLTYTPAVGYENYAATWKVNGTALEGNSFTMPDAAVTVTVELEQVMNATFVFNTDAGLTALGITKPTTSGTGTDLDPNTDYTSGIVTMNITHGGTNTRVWNNGGTTTELRVYNGNNNNNNVDGTLTFSVPNGVLITGITFSCASGYVLSDWSSNTGEQSVTFTASAQKRIYTATVAYTSTSAVLPPSFNPGAGTYNVNQSVEITCTTNGADIRYTTNGEAPTTSSALYEGAITVDRNMTIKAIAIKDSQTSEPAEAQYVLTPLAPTFNPVGGPYTGTQTVTIECGTTGATLSYKLGDGDWTAYNEPVEVSASTTLYAKAHKDNWTDSESSATYTITQPLANIAALTANSEAGSYLVTLSEAVVTYVNGNYAYIQDASGAVLYYKNGHGLTAGKTFTGTATVTFGFNYGNPQITAISGVTPADGQAPNPTSLAASSWNYTFTDVISQYFHITGATLTKTGNYYYVSLGGESIQLYKRGTALGDLDLTKTYTITGFPTKYVSGDNTIYELTIFTAPEEEVVPVAPVWSTLPQDANITLGEEYNIDLSAYVSGVPAPTIELTSAVDGSNTAVPDDKYSFTNSELTFQPTVAGTYTFSFSATNSQGSANATLTITAEAGAVPVLTVGELTATTAAVSWTECEGVASYTLEIAPYLICESFEYGIPSTWTNNSVINPSGKGGDGTYCIGFNASGDYLITPALNNPKSITFMYKRSSNSTAWSLDVSYATTPDASEENWTNIETIEDASTSWQTFSASLDVTGSVYIRFKDTRSSGTHERYIDLIQITGSSTTTSETGLSHTFSELSSGTKYTARVKGNGDWSNVVNFTIPYTKGIQAYTQDSKDYYYLIASPVGVIDPVAAGMITDDGTDPSNRSYDLYYFDQSEESEWRNYRATSYAIESGKGYLYANKNSITLSFTGQPYNGDGVITLDSVPGTEFAGWNLIGNPLATNATLDRPFFRMNATGSGFESVTEESVVYVMEGVFVKGKADETATFTAQTRGGGRQAIAKANIQVIGSRGTVIDNAIVRFDNGETLEKFIFGNPAANIYFAQDGKEYAIIRSEAQGEMPVNFKAAENGTYTISVEAENLDVEYLHLIDNMTGANVDLLATPSYTFEARKSDYASRFRLVFSANAGNSEVDDDFAFVSDGNIVISNEGEATLQVIDMLGRVVSTQSVNGNASIENVGVAGVYVLRLVNGNNVKTQRIVVR